MKKIFVFTILILFLVPPLFSQNVDAVIKEVTGKVEFKAPLKNWEAARVGLIIPRGSLVSTGFKSTVLLELGQSSLMVKQLTRMTLEELVVKEGTQTTGVFLRVGRVSAQVKSVAGIQNDFKVRSPVSTAAVRGTSYEFNGRVLTVGEGGVSLEVLATGETKWIFEGTSAYVEGLSLVSGEDVLSDGYDTRLTAEEREIQTRFLDSSYLRGDLAITWQQ